MDTKKLTILPIFLLLLSMFSVAFAMWSETLRVNATVNTGELDWEFMEGTLIQLDTCDFPVNDYNASFLPQPGSQQLDKNVGCTDLELIDSDNDGDYDTLKITMHNVYPWYYEHIAFKVHNDGTIPLKIWRVIINGNIYHELNPGVIEGEYFDFDGDGKNDTLVWWGNNFGVQLDPCESADISLDITILQDAHEGSTITFTIQVDAIQWNEYEEHIP
ncbi:MAG: hypothetical protein DRN04_18790 [Thermoprotei archaeon]|nr:MAG: hypothetical protein DRN04_18790 [Thermoprotei archaeon]